METEKLGKKSAHLRPRNPAAKQSVAGKQPKRRERVWTPLG